MSDYNKQSFIKDLQEVEDNFKARLRTLRTGRAKPEAFNNIQVEAYGTVVPLQSLANVVIETALSVVINPYDRNASADIVKAIVAADLGLNPVNEGERIRINIPALTEESRLQTVKEMGDMHEHARIEVRKVRQHHIDRIDKMTGVSEDVQESQKKEIQTEIDKANKELKELADKKELEIMSI